MDIAELSNRTGLGMRRLRYVIEYAVLPPLEGLTPGRGAGRKFDDYTGFLVAVAAYMLEMGLRRSVATQVMEAILEYRKRGLPLGSVMVPIIQNAYGFAKRSTLEIGDGCNVRIDSDPPFIRAGSGSIQPMSLPWTQLATQAVLAEGYEPFGSVIVRVDMLARRIRAS
jgi:hypothetical protein